MKRTAILAAFSLAAAAAQAPPPNAPPPKTPPPKTWIDPDTGHRVVRLTESPGSANFYFNQNSFTADGRSLIYTTSGGIYALDLVTREPRQIVSGRVQAIAAGYHSQNVYYRQGDEIFAVNADTRAVRRIGKLPRRGSIATINANETLLAGTYIEGDGADYGNRNPAPAQPGAPLTAQVRTLDQPANKGQMMEQRLAAHLPMALFTMDASTGDVKVIHRSTDWLNHLVFSPTDPKLLMFCHEGPWHKVDRIWTIRADTARIAQIHTRTMAGEIFGHEFWSHDGKTIWYDLQTPRGEDFWLAGYNVETGERRQYHLQRNEWSIHFNANADGTLFCGDGGDPSQVARATDGRWIYLFRPHDIRFDGALNQPGFIQPGVLQAEKLVNMAKHDYRVEPNVVFTPDGRWVIFRGNTFGDSYVFAAEIAKAL